MGPSGPRERSRYNRGDGSSNAVAFVICSSRGVGSGQDQKENICGHLGLLRRAKSRVHFPQLCACQARQIRVARDGHAALPHAKPLQIQAVSSACREQRPQKSANRAANGAIRKQVWPSCSAARKWDCYIPYIHHIASSSQRAKPITRSQSVMPPRGLMSSFAFAALAATASLLATPQAQAQGLFEFLWGGGQEWGGSKQNVSFDREIHPGPDHRQLRRPPPVPDHQVGPGDELSDRRAARAEPLAGRHHRHRQADEPVLASDSRDAARKSQTAAVGAGRPPHEPARRARHVSGIEPLPHSRHRRAVDHRPSRLQGLHPHAQ